MKIPKSRMHRILRLSKCSNGSSHIRVIQLLRITMIYITYSSLTCNSMSRSHLCRSLYCEPITLDMIHPLPKTIILALHSDTMMTHGNLCHIANMLPFEFKCVRARRFSIFECFRPVGSKHRLFPNLESSGCTLFANSSRHPKKTWPASTLTPMVSYHFTQVAKVRAANRCSRAALSNRHTVRLS